MVRAGAQLVARLLAFPRPVLTVCTGHAYPMGAFLMLAADVRLGARRAVPDRHERDGDRPHGAEVRASSWRAIA